jgi:heme/copper-type cytochrome/quinol oxidase subunit 2
VTGEKKINQKKLVIYLFGLLMLAANNIVLYVTFLHAYFFNDYTFSAHINQYGEAHVELFVLGASLIIGLLTVIHFMRIMVKQAQPSTQ